MNFRRDCVAQEKTQAANADKAQKILGGKNSKKNLPLSNSLTGFAPRCIAAQYGA
jgi:hypothetical protein